MTTTALNPKTMAKVAQIDAEIAQLNAQIAELRDARAQLCWDAAEERRAEIRRNIVIHTRREL